MKPFWAHQTHSIVFLRGISGFGVTSDQVWATVFCWLDYRSKSTFHHQLRSFFCFALRKVFSWFAIMISECLQPSELFPALFIVSKLKLKLYSKLSYRFCWVNFKNLLQFFIISLSMSPRPVFFVEVKVS